MRLLRALAGFVALAAAAGTGNAREETFPNQPGALSAEELEDATKAMRQAAGGGAEFALVASGRRNAHVLLPGYALFAQPFRDFSGHVSTRRQVICNFFRPMDRWQCGPSQDEFKLKTNGIEHDFSYELVQAPSRAQAAVDAAEFMYSACFWSQLEAAGGARFTPSPDTDYVSIVVDDGKALRVRTGARGDGRSYELVPAEKAARGCGFRIAGYRKAEPSPAPQAAAEPPLVMSERGARERAGARQAREAESAAMAAKMQREQQERLREQNKLFELGPFSMDKPEAAAALAQAGTLALLLTLWLPGVARRKKGNWAAPAVALALSVGGILLGALASHLHESTYEGYLFFTLPAILISWIAVVGHFITALVRELRGS